MAGLIFKEPGRADYCANRLFDVLYHLHHYASTAAPAGLDQARDQLGAIAEVSRSGVNYAIDKMGEGMIMGLPDEVFENDNGHGPLSAHTAEENIRYWRLRKAGDAV